MSPSQLATMPPDSAKESPRRSKPVQLPDTQPQDPYRRSRAVRPWAVLPVVVVAALLAWGARSWIVAGRPGVVRVTATVTRATLPITILAGGELESSKTIDVFCEVEGQQTKVVEMLPEGTLVAQGQVIVRLDPSDVNQRLARQEITVMKAQAAVKVATEEVKIQENLAASRIAQAGLALTLAELDRKKYLQGDYMVEEKDLRGSIALAQTQLQEAKDTLAYFHDLVKKGFRTPEQLRAKEQEVMRAEYNLSRDEEKLRVLENFTRERQLVELTAKVREARREIERAKSSSGASVAKTRTDLEAALGTARLETQQLEKLQQQLENCDVKAPIAGTLVYAEHKRQEIELGSAVHYKQKLFSLPDMTQMQVNVFVHESVVKKVSPGLQAEIRIEAYPHMVLQGTVQSVATFYDGGRHWWSGGVKEYVAVVTIDQLPEFDLKPGMTAQVNILAAQLSDALIVPVQAVIQEGDQHHCYVAGSDGVQRRRVSVGENNDNFVQILDGLAEGEHVTLDARGRAAAQSRDLPIPEHADASL